MPKDHARKNAARRAQQRTGAAYTSANAATTHTHPAPDLASLADLPYTRGHRIELDRATALVGAARAGCGPCLDTLIPQVADSAATVAALAGGALGILPPVLAAALPDPARAWVRVLHEQADDAAPVHVLSLMPADHRRDLLETTVDFWAAGAAQPPVFETITLDEPDDGSDPVYGVTLSELEATGPQGSQRLPMLILNPQSGDAGLEDLLHRCGLPVWDATTLPPADARWRVRFDIATRSLEGIAHIDADGFDDISLFQAAEQVTLPDHWWDLVDTTETVLLCGPLKDATPPEEALADGVALAGVRARARFL
ncbi:hypothetical protein [Nocardiopsis sp. NRRL B-16309]|uniref:hypothetical protein n=1 Tax=Nocardiopsis sp. NRRL B-16309 TaxID=1519494 RepID=UPI0006AF5E65|nr:hypothetical protein [Nocardiopsis sp. NRRL B-16309]KOX13676.1 hypothetical protein ADL05_18500 [Nocardiopsis sp. NRRL B-16309]